MSSKLRRILTVSVRHIFSWPRDLEALSDTFWWPTFDVFVWGLMTVYLQKAQGVSAIFLNFFIGGLVLWMFVYRSQQEMAVQFLREVWDRNLLNILTTPITIWEYLLGNLVLGLVKVGASAVWMVLLASFLFAFNIVSFGWLLVPFVVSLLIVGWSAGFIITGLVVQYGYRYQALAWILVACLQPFSAVFYEVSSMPAWMQAVARVLPTSYIFEGMREVVGSGHFSYQKLVIATGLNVVYLLLALLFFKKSFQRALRSGMIVKFS